MIAQFYIFLAVSFPLISFAKTHGDDGDVKPVHYVLRMASPQGAAVSSDTSAVGRRSVATATATTADDSERGFDRTILGEHQLPIEDTSQSPEAALRKIQAIAAPVKPQPEIQNQDLLKELRDNFNLFAWPFILHFSLGQYASAYQELMKIPSPFLRQNVASLLYEGLNPRSVHEMMPGIDEMIREKGGPEGVASYKEEMYGKLGLLGL